MPSPMSWQLSFLGCYPVAGEPSEYWIAIWLAEYSLNPPRTRRRLLLIKQFLMPMRSGHSLLFRSSLSSRAF
jgi:hypothetical protein